MPATRSVGLRRHLAARIHRLACALALGRGELLSAAAFERTELVRELRAPRAQRLHLLGHGRVPLLCEPAGSKTWGCSLTQPHGPA